MQKAHLTKSNSASSLKKKLTKNRKKIYQFDKRQLTYLQLKGDLTIQLHLKIREKRISLLFNVVLGVLASSIEQQKEIKDFHIGK